MRGTHLRSPPLGSTSILHVMERSPMISTSWVPAGFSRFLCARTTGGCSGFIRRRHISWPAWLSGRLTSCRLVSRSESQESTRVTTLLMLLTLLLRSVQTCSSNKKKWSIALTWLRGSAGENSGAALDMSRRRESANVDEKERREWGCPLSSLNTQYG